MEQKKITALEEAKRIFDRLVNLQINRTPAPRGQIDIFAVAALPGGKMLMSDGTIKVSSATKKLRRVKSQEKDIFRMPGARPQGETAIRDIGLQIAIPAKHMGTSEDKVFAFTNYLNNLLRPRLETPPGIGHTFLPSPKGVQPFYKPSALANLPPLVKRVGSMFPQRQPGFIDNTQRIQRELTQRFLTHFARGERPAAYASLGGLGKTPLVAKYKAEAFRIPTEQNVQYAQFSGTPAIERRMIY